MDTNQSIFGQAFSTALQQQVTEDSVAFMPDEREAAYRGNIGWATTRNLFRLYTTTTLDNFNLTTKMEKGEDSYKGIVQFNGQEYRVSNTLAGASFVWFDDVMAAGAMKEFITKEDGVAFVFSERELVMPIDKIVYWGNDKFKEIVTARGDDLTSSVGVTGMSRWKQNWRNFVAMHLLYLPSAVAAVAKWGQRDGLADSQVDISDIWSVRPLYAAAQYEEDGTMFFSEEAQREVIGDEDGFTESILFQQRAALWKLFGENNPLAYLPGKTTGKYAMESDSLRSVIEMIMGVWKAPALVAIGNHPLPVHDLIDGQGRPIRQDIIENWFNTEEEAHVFTAESDGLVVDVTGGKQLPDSWTGMPKEWAEAVKDVKKRFDSPEKVESDTLSLLEATVEDLKVWW